MPDQDILALNAFDPRAATAIGQAVERRLRSFGAGSVLFYQEPIEMVRAEGVWLHAADGRHYLDVYNNVPSVGHCHPRVVEAVRRQVGTLNIHTRYLNAVVDAYAERLLATLPAAIDNLVLTCTGSEANDLALRVARAATGGQGFVVTRTAYHGNTAAVTDISPASRPGRPLAPHVRAVAPPDLYRAPDPGARLAAAVAEAAADLKQRGLGFAGFIADSVFSSDGVHVDPVGLLGPVVEAVRAASGLFIADEVQPGFGRTGAALWGFARHGVVPDIVTLGKPMGNGFPMGGMALNADLLAAFNAEDKYFNTFGGNPVAAAAGLAVLDVIRDEGLIDNARAVGDHLLQGLREIANAHVAIGDVRGAGLFIGLELVADREARTPAPAIATAVIEGLRREGILIGAAGPHGSTLKIRPPLCFSRDNADRVVEACDTVLRGLPVG
ncbi:aspartate aminotransferase family protein [Labrys wisconsinensis]|uniref:4-aminobutyrate aminotransferase-like enzyme n=1 Tax=Labrys wisconsinensis TaxID=425677 RepID=A0ABU0J0B1_9HYPH|nr:aminotransferase class III-fold pyridoxal phosphate-dependent enzyme [Labrys wisconsinensis]MDQ0467709.1 4-aminobutyrate aminotransferase-like enzyme [Labrys wisconsinensis]